MREHGKFTGKLNLTVICQDQLGYAVLTTNPQNINSLKQVYFLLMLHVHHRSTGGTIHGHLSGIRVTKAPSLQMCLSGKGRDRTVHAPSFKGYHLCSHLTGQSHMAMPVSSQPGATLSLKRHLAMSADISDGHN